MSLLVDLAASYAHQSLFVPSFYWPHTIIELRFFCYDLIPSHSQFSAQPMCLSRFSNRGLTAYSLRSRMRPLSLLLLHQTLLSPDPGLPTSRSSRRYLSTTHSSILIRSRSLWLTLQHHIIFLKHIRQLNYFILSSGSFIYHYLRYF